LNIFLRTICWEALFSAQGIQDEAFEQLWGKLARAGDSLSLYYQPLLLDFNNPLFRHNHQLPVSSTT